MGVPVESNIGFIEFTKAEQRVILYNSICTLTLWISIHHACFPPTGYCFLLFQDEMSVQALIDACIVDDSKLYWCVSSPTMKDKPVSHSFPNANFGDFPLAHGGIVV